MEKRILIAPNLDSAHLGARLVCHRPCRRGPPRICVEYRGERDQLIAHNYGHAGSGWTVGPGVAEHSVQQMGKAVEERRQKGVGMGIDRSNRQKRYAYRHLGIRHLRIDWDSDTNAIVLPFCILNPQCQSKILV